MGTKKTQKASDYHEKAILEQLEDLADKLSIEVRYERFTGEGSLSTGGLCRVKDRHFFIINSKVFSFFECFILFQFCIDIQHIKFF